MCWLYVDSPALIYTPSDFCPTHIVGESELRKEERSGLERKRLGVWTDVTWTKNGTLAGSEKNIAILGDRWRPQTAKEEGGKIL